MRAKPFSSMTFGLVLLAAAGTTAARVAAAQPSVVLGAEEVRATVETVDQQARTVLLRGPTGALLTVHAGPEVRNLPQVKPGDQVVLRYAQAVAARIARPGDPDPESTTTMSSAAPGERPAGLVVDHIRRRVTIEGVDPREQHRLLHRPRPRAAHRGGAATGDARLPAHAEGRGRGRAHLHRGCRHQRRVRSALIGLPCQRR